MTETPLTARAIEAPLPWGPVLRGERWGDARHTILLLHEPGADLDAWGALPRALARALPARSVSLDLPGHGLSDDPWEPERLAEIVGALGDDLLSSGRAILVAAGATALVALAAAPQLHLAGLVCLSPDAPDADWTPTRSPGTAKLFFAGSLAENDVDTARRLASSCGGWASVTSIPVAERGSGLLATAWYARIEEHITAFARDCLSPRPARTLPAPTLADVRHMAGLNQETSE